MERAKRERKPVQEDMQTKLFRFEVERAEDEDCKQAWAQDFAATKARFMEPSHAQQLRVNTFRRRLKHTDEVLFSNGIETHPGQ